MRHSIREGSDLSSFCQGCDSAVPEDVRRELGKAIFDLQKGENLKMPLSRAMVSIAPGAGELRIRDRSGSFRVLGKRRLKELLDEEI